MSPPYDVPWSAGVPTATIDQVVVCPPNDIKAAEIAFERGDIAAVILEPAGGGSGTTPTIPGYLAELRALATRHNVVLIFDEVITGFRYSPGGAQQYFNVTPDLTTLAKIVAGGLPGGALAGRRDIMSMIAFRGDPDWDRSSRVAHAGTFNANPLSAAAGTATLELCADASLQARANKSGEELRRALSESMKKLGVPGTCFGEASIFHVSFEGKPGLAGFDRPRKHSLYQLLRCALLNNGVDCAAHHGWISVDARRGRSAADRAGLRARLLGSGRRRRVQGDVMRRRVALAALALLLGGCVHYPTVEDIGRCAHPHRERQGGAPGRGAWSSTSTWSAPASSATRSAAWPPRWPGRRASSTPAARRSRSWRCRARRP